MSWKIHWFKWNDSTTSSSGCRAPKRYVLHFFSTVTPLYQDRISWNFLHELKMGQSVFCHGDILFWSLVRAGEVQKYFSITLFGIFLRQSEELSKICQSQNQSFEKLKFFFFFLTKWHFGGTTPPTSTNFHQLPPTSTNFRNVKI